MASSPLLPAPPGALHGSLASLSPLQRFGGRYLNLLGCLAWSLSSRGCAPHFRPVLDWIYGGLGFSAFHAPGRKGRCRNTAVSCAALEHFVQWSCKRPAHPCFSVLTLSGVPARVGFAPWGSSREEDPVPAVLWLPWLQPRLECWEAILQVSVSGPRVSPSSQPFSRASPNLPEWKEANRKRVSLRSVSYFAC